MDPNQMPQPSPEMGAGMPPMPSMPQMSGMPMPPMPPAPDPSMAPPEMPLPEMSEEMGPEMAEAESLMAEPSSPNKDGDGMKKELLKKMMSNLLSKPNRSVNEMINGVKAVIGAYKNYAKEWDALNGVVETPVSATSDGGGAGSGDEIQKILRSVQSKKAETKDGGGGPGMMPAQMPQPPQPSAMPQNNGYRAPAPIAHLGIMGY